MELKSTRDAYGETLRKIGSNNQVVVLDADLSISTKTSVFAKQYPHRFFDVGCAEQNLIGVAAGLALCGRTVFASTYATFITRALDQVRNTVAHDNLNVKIVVTHAGLTNASDGASHQGLEDIAIMRTFPNMRVLIPADAVETEKMLLYELQEPGPAYIRLNRAESPVIFDNSYQYDMKKAEIIREGADVALFATGTMVPLTLEAAEHLKKDSVDACVVNVHTIKPLDTDTINRIVRRCGAAVTAEEHSIHGGLGSAVAECICENPVPLKIIGVQDQFGQSGNYGELLKIYGLSSEKIRDAAHAVMKVKK